MEVVVRSRLQESASLQSDVRHLRYALVTTTCRETVDVLQKMLKKAEARLERQKQRLNASNSKLL